MVVATAIEDRARLRDKLANLYLELSLQELYKQKITLLSRLDLGNNCAAGEGYFKLEERIDGARQKEGRIIYYKLIKSGQSILNTSRSLSIIYKAG